MSQGPRSGHCDGVRVEEEEAHGGRPGVGLTVGGGAIPAGTERREDGMARSVSSLAPLTLLPWHEPSLFFVC